MRPLLNLVGVFCVLGVVPVSVAAAEWSGSYATGSSCYCSGTLKPQLAHRVVPTPIGGQSIAQICRRVGSGPALNQVDGRFNYPVYKDAQCGNGPYSTGTEPADGSCAGTIEPGTDDCQAVGPQWDLQAAYSGESKAARGISPAAAGIEGVTKAVATKTTAAKDDAQTVAVPSAAKADAGVAPRIVIIDGKTFQEASPGTPDQGGAPGSRIVLDGIVFVTVIDGEQIKPSENTTAQISQRTAKVAPKVSPKVNRERDEKRARQEKLIADARRRLKQQSGEPKQTEKPATEAVVQPDVVAEVKKVDEVKVAEAEKDVQKDVTAKKPNAPTNTVSQAATGKVQKPDNGSDKLAETDRQDALDEAATTVASNAGKTNESVFVNALRMPPATRASSRDFSYLDAMPISYDFGGAGMWLEGSTTGSSRIRYLARAGLANEYQEVLLGASWFLTPAKADRLTLVGTVGVEAGHFDFEAPDISADYESLGMYLGIASRAVINDRFELRAGLGYSSFFEGDFTVDGGAFFHINRQLDIVSRFEIGDNDSLGIGVRYYY